MERKTLWGLLLLNFVYIICGGVIFNLLESTKEQAKLQAQHTNYKSLRSEILRNFTCISERELDLILTRVVDLYDSGELTPENNTNLDWDIDSAIFFATTIVTTIGYGHISPVTTGGRVFCIFYALIGIPLSLVVLSGLGHRISRFLTRMDEKLNKGLFPPKVGSVLRALLLTLVGFCLFVLVPAGLFTTKEEWTYGEGVYYSVVSLTTVGFGDLVAGVDNELKYGWWYHLMVSGWLWLGLAWCATTISSFQESYETVFHTDEPNDGTKDDIPLVENGYPISYTDPPEKK